MKDHPGKPVSASSIEGHIYQVFPNDLNPNDTIFGGRIMEIADMLAAACAKMHAECTCATLLVDSLRFLNPARRGEILIFRAAVNRTWKTSMEIGIKVTAKEIGAEETKRVVSAFFTFVALDSNNKPRPVIAVIPETEEQKRRYEEADIRRLKRLEASALKDAYREKKKTDH